VVRRPEPHQSLRKRHQCDWEGCTRESVGFWNAQWSIADFGEWFWCEYHKQDIGEVLVNRTVDGQSILDITAHRYWD
jgi:hypothetical protein